MNYKPDPGTTIDRAAETATAIAKATNESITFDFNGVVCMVDPAKSEEENKLACRAALGLPPKDPPFHPVTALDALARWDDGKTVFTIEMGGLGPGYEQAIQILVFELIRDNATKPLPSPDSTEADSWGDKTVSRINDACGGFSGAQVGAARHIAYRAIRDGWANMLASAPQDRYIQVSKFMPSLTVEMAVTHIPKP